MCVCVCGRRCVCGWSKWLHFVGTTSSAARDGAVFFFFLRLLFRARTQHQTFTVSVIANKEVVNDTVHTRVVQVGVITLGNLQDVGRRSNDSRQSRWEAESDVHLP